LTIYEGPRKSLHILISDEAHAQLKGVCASKRLTMQEFLEACIHGLLEEKDFFVKLAEKIAEEKGVKIIKRVNITDEDAVYRAIGGNE